MSNGYWHIERPSGHRWNKLRASWDDWFWGTDYPTREAAEAEALLLVVKYPEYLGKLSVRMNS